MVGAAPATGTTVWRSGVSPPVVEGMTVGVQVDPDWVETSIPPASA